MPDTPQQPGPGTAEKTKRSRITAACAVCRAKRQKCSGEKPVCDQCRAHNEHCWWSDQKKRGPAKDYLRSLQDRLQETERLLLGVLDKVSDDDVLQTLQANAADTTPIPSHQTWAGALSGPEYWSQHPLADLESIRDWQSHRVSVVQSTSTTQGPNHPAAATPRNASLPSAAEASMGAPTAVMAGQASDAQNGSQPYYRNGMDGQYATDAIEPSLRNPPGDGAVSHQRRYSEETRGVAEALFSISANGGASSRSQPQQKGPSAPETGRQTRTSAKADNLPDEFPKHLFW